MIMINTVASGTQTFTQRGTRRAASPAFTAHGSTPPGSFRAALFFCLRAFLAAFLSSGDAHSVQNFAPASTSAPQLGQVRALSVSSGLITGSSCSPFPSPGAFILSTHPHREELPPSIVSGHDDPEHKHKHEDKRDNLGAGGDHLDDLHVLQ